MLKANTPNFWLLDPKTKEARQLTFGTLDFRSDCTPDGKTLYYLDSLPVDGVTRIFKLLIDGGHPTEVARGNIESLKISPDGKYLAYFDHEGAGASGQEKIVIRLLSTNAVVKEVDAPLGFEIGWSPDSRSVTYLRVGSNSQDLYLRSIEGGSPIRIMHFEEEPSSIESYAWSKDGRKIAVRRARFNDTDIVLFTGLR